MPQQCAESFVKNNTQKVKFAKFDFQNGSGKIFWATLYKKCVFVYMVTC